VRHLPAVAALCFSGLSCAAATFTWDDVTGTWSTGVNWAGDVAPVSDAANELVFGASAAYTATHDLGAAFNLNILRLNSLVATGPVTLNASGGSTLSFVANGATNPTVFQQTASLFTVDIPLVISAPTTFGGSGSGLVTLPNVLSGGGALSFTGANWRITNIANSFTGGLTVGTGASVELAPAGSPATVNLTPGATSIVGSNTVTATNPITIDGGTLKLTTAGAGTITFGDNRALTFGANGGILDVRNSGTGGGNITSSGTNDLALTLTNTAGNPAIIKFNGGQLGLSATSTTNPGNWDTDNNTLRVESYTGGAANPLRIELDNGAAFKNRAATIPVPVTLRGVVGGDPTSGSAASVNAAMSLTTGRIFVDVNAVTNYQQGLTLEGALQFGCVGAARAIDGNITLVNGAFASFNGRGTGTALGPAINNPGTATAGQNPIWIGQNGDDTLTVQSGAIAAFDSRIRHDVASNNAVLMNAKAVIQAGGELRIMQSLSRATAAASGQAGANSTTSVAAPHIIDGDIQGQGSTASESVLSIYLPLQAGTDTNGDQVPDTAFGDLGGVVFRTLTTPPTTSTGTDGVGLIVNGTGFGGLRVEGRSRPTALLGGADLVLNSDKIANLLTATRLAALTGTGGYLTPAANGSTFTFPSGGEWVPGVSVGLRVVDSNVGVGTDVSMGGTTFAHNLDVSTNATLDTGVGAFTFGPLVPTAGLGTLSGNGTISGTGGLTLSAGGILSPGEGGTGTLTEANNLSLTSGSQFVFDLATIGSSDLVATFGTLTLGGQQFSDFTFNALAGFGPGTYTLFDNTALSGSLGASLTGTVNGLGATLSISGSDVVLSVVPEPSAALSVIGGCAMLLGLRRRRTV
jgi:hypothetical protein